MNGYATLTADEHEMEAGVWARFADKARRGEYIGYLFNGRTTRESIRICQNLSAMHMEDALRMRKEGTR